MFAGKSPVEAEHAHNSETYPHPAEEELYKEVDNPAVGQAECRILAALIAVGNLVEAVADIPVQGWQVQARLVAAGTLAQVEEHKAEPVVEYQIPD